MPGGFFTFLCLCWFLKLASSPDTSDRAYESLFGQSCLACPEPILMLKSQSTDWLLLDILHFIYQWMCSTNLWQLSSYSRHYLVQCKTNKMRLIAPTLLTMIIAWILICIALWICQLTTWLCFYNLGGPILIHQILNTVLNSASKVVICIYYCCNHNTSHARHTFAHTKPQNWAMMVDLYLIL